MSAILFCPNCNSYLEPAALICPSCEREREPHGRPTQPGQPLWSAELGGPARGRPVITDDLALFAWGNRRGAGGVIALNHDTGEQRWQVSVPYSVEAGLVLVEERLLFATLSFLGSGAQLYCCQLETGDILWQKPLTDSAWSTPVVDEVRVYVSSYDGRVNCFDLRSGEPLSGWPARLPRGRIWLALHHNRLIAVTEGGRIYVLNPLSAGRTASRYSETGQQVSSPPLISGDQLIFGVEGGTVVSYDMQNCSIRTLAQGFKAVVAAPAISRGVLYVGAHDHFLHAIDFKSGQELWKAECDRAISCSPAVSDDMVAVGANDGCVHAFNAQSGERIWRFAYNGEMPVLCSPVFKDCVIYGGAENRRVCALPWHLGHYESAAEKMEIQNDLHNAAVLYALGAYFEVQHEERKELYKQAVKCWASLGQPEWAGRLWEGLAHEGLAAQAYCDAGDERRGRNNHLAAELFYRASRLYWRIDQPEKEHQSASEAARLGRWPLIRLISRDPPRLTQNKPGSITIRAENIGYNHANNLKFNVGGSLVQPVRCEILQPLSPGTYFDVTFSNIIPTKDVNSLQVEVEYEGTIQRNNPFSTCLNYDIEAVPLPYEVEIGDTVLSKFKFSVSDSANRRVKIKVGDMVKGDLDFQFGETHE